MLIYQMKFNILCFKDIDYTEYIVEFIHSSIDICNRRSNSYSYIKKK